MSYSDLAPIISGAGISQNQVENYFNNLPTQPEPQPEPIITVQKIQALANIYYNGDDLANHGGLKQVASDVGLSTDQAKLLIQEFDKLFAAWQSQQ